MPIYKTISPDVDTTIVVWHITEEESEIKEGIYLNEGSTERVNGMKSELHRKGFYSIRHLLKYCGYNDNDLYYEKSGKPLLKDGKKISISHSFEFSGIIISDKEVGIDIEKNRDKIKRIAHKFTAEQTILCPIDPIKHLTAIWGIKESLYKIYPHGGLDFKNEIPIIPFDSTSKKTIAEIKKENWNKTYTAFIHPIENFTLVYAY